MLTGGSRHLGIVECIMLKHLQRCHCGTVPTGQALLGVLVHAGTFEQLHMFECGGCMLAKALKMAAAGNLEAW